MTSKTASSINPADLAAMIPGADQGDDQDVQVGPAATFASSPGVVPAANVAPDPAPAPNGSGRAPARASARLNGKQAPTARQAMSAMMPSSLRVHVYKRTDSGQLASAKDYGANDLLGSGTMEAFIRKYVIPEYDYGEFHLYQSDGTPGVAPVSLGSVTILAPRSRTDDEAKTSSLKEMWELAQKMNEQNRPPQKSPMEEMFLTYLMKQMDKQSESKGSGGMDPMMMFFMMQMMNKPQQGPDPIMLKVLERIEQMGDERMAQAMIPPAPTPAPMADPMVPVIQLMQQSMQQQTAMMIETIRSSQVKPTDRDAVKDLADLSKLLGQKDDDRFTMKDIIGMIPQFREFILPASSQKDPFEKTIENFRLFKMLQSEFDGGGPRDAAEEDRESAAGFWEFAKTFLQSDLGSSLADAIKAGNSAQQVDQRQGMRRHATQQVAAEVSQRRGPQQPAQAQPAQQGRPVAPAPTVAPVPPAQEDDIQIPEGFILRHAPKINSAANDMERVPAIVEGIRFLATSNDFRPHVVEVFGLTKQNRKEEALAKIEGLLGALADAEVLDPCVIKLAREDFTKHWNLIRKRMNMPDVPELDPQGNVVEPAPEVVSSVPAQAQPAAPAPVRAVVNGSEPAKAPAETPAPAHRPRPAVPPPTYDDEPEGGEDDAPVERPKKVHARAPVAVPVKKDESTALAAAPQQAEPVMASAKAG